MSRPLAPQQLTQDGAGPLFSVVIPTYNQADLLREALASVLGQTFPRFEVVLVDNHSTDHTLGVVKSFPDPRLRVIRVHNEGVIAVSRNLGIRESGAPLVAFLDSDDVWYPQKLERVYQAWRQQPEAGLVCHDEYAVRQGRVLSRLRYGPCREDMYRFLLLNGCRLSTSATVVCRSWLEQVGGFSEDPELTGVEDYDLWLRLAGLGRFHFLHEFLGEFRLHSKSHSASSGVHLNHTLYLLDRHFERLAATGKPLPGQLRRRERASRYAGAARTAPCWWGRDGCLAYCGAALGESPLFWKTYARVGRSLGVRLLDRAGGVVRSDGRPSPVHQRIP